MTYVRTEAGQLVEYPFDPSFARQRFPQISFPEQLTDSALEAAGIFPVLPVEPPAASSEEIAEEGPPEFSGGAWRQTWTIRALGSHELAQAKARKLKALAALRYEKETAGILIGQTMVPTDRETCSIITGAYVRATRNPNYRINFKSPDGSWTPIDAPTIIMVGDLVSDHVQACFDREKDLSAEIRAAESFAALAAIDINSGW